MNINILRIPVGSYQTNCYILYDSKNNGIIIDPGAEEKKIISAISKYDIKPQLVLLTHAHIDHIEALPEIIDEYDIPFYLHEEEEKVLENRNLSLANLMGIESEKNKPAGLLHDGEILNFNDNTIKVIHTPGHTPGSVSFLIDEVVFTGDTLFYGSIGRTDFPGGDYDTIINSLLKLMKLDDEIVALPGHGQETNIKFERLNNPFLKGVI